MQGNEKYDSEQVKKILEEYLTLGHDKPALVNEVKQFYCDFKMYNLTNILKGHKPNNTAIQRAVLLFISNSSHGCQTSENHSDFHDYLIKEITSSECYETSSRYIGNYYLFRHAINHDAIVVTLISIYKNESDNRVYFTQIKKTSLDLLSDASVEDNEYDETADAVKYITHGIVYSFANNIYLYGAVKTASEFIILSQDNSDEISHLFGVTVLEAPSNLRIGASRVYLRKVSRDILDPSSNIGLYPQNDKFVKNVFLNYLQDTRDTFYRVISKK